MIVPGAIAPPPGRFRVAAAYAAVYLAWGSTYFAIRIGVREFSPAALGGLRFALAGSLMLALRRLLGGAAATRRETWNATGIGVVLLAGGTGFLGYAERTVPSGVTALVIGCSPMLFAIFNRWAGGPPLRANQLAGGVLGMIGIAVLAWEGSSSRELIFPLSGLGLLLVGMVCWTSASVASAHLELPRDALWTAAVQNFAASAVLLLAAFARGEVGMRDLAAIPPGALGAIAYLAVVGSCVGFTAYTWLLRREPSNRVSSYAFVNPVVAVLLGAGLGGEAVTPGVLAAMGLVIGGVSLSMLGRRTVAPPEGTDAV